MSAKLSPEHIDRTRSQATERMLKTASNMMECMRAGLTQEGCRTVCDLLLPETRAIAVAMTDREYVLAYVGELEADFPPGSLIHTNATHEVLESGVLRTFATISSEGTSALAGLSPEERERRLKFNPAGIVAPLTVKGETVGTIKFYYATARDIDRTQLTIARGFAELLSSQLSVYELDRQAELTAKAEVKALQAQINPHFLFNTLNTIASFTRTDPARARVLLRDFAVFYRQTIENSESRITVERELEQTRRYLEFEHARFGDDRIIEREHVEEGCEDTPVPAFVIQPIVENAVRHAMSDEGPLHIDVYVLTEGDDVLISVTDDGLGMPQETASRLVDGSGSSEEGTGIALHNVAERVKRFYGLGSNVEIVSRPGQGTCVTLRLVDAARG